MTPWRTAIIDAGETHIRVRGYDITDLMRQAGFVDTVFLLHRGRLPTAGEKRVLDAVFVAVADHGPGAPSCAAARLAASGNRQSISAAIAAGVLAIGDEHGGAGEACMALIASSLEGVTAGDNATDVDAAATRAFAQARETRTRIPGLGHRVHTVDPRVSVLFGLAAEAGVAGAGIRFVRALEAAATAAGKPLPINIDGALAAVLHDMGFPPPAGKFIFIIGRVAGLTAEVAEELAREKAMRIRIPVEYDGEAPRALPGTKD
jgi:citrate synthase